MIYNSLDMTSLLYQLLIDGGIGTTIDGDVYKDRRPVNSESEDIVINAIALSTDSFQNGTANVNCFAPDIEITIDDMPQKVPDHARLHAITYEVCRILKSVIQDGYSVFVENTNLIQDQQIGQTYINIRVKVFIAQTS